MQPIPLTRPDVHPETTQALIDVLHSEWLTQGTRVQSFEQVLAQRFHAAGACAVSSGTAGLHLALRVAGVQPGDVVLTVSHSFVATANAVRHCGAEPIFVDIDPATLNMDPVHAQQVIADWFQQGDDGYHWLVPDFPLPTENVLARARPPAGRLAALLVVHQVGMPANMCELAGLADRFDLRIIEDAACAFGSVMSLDDGQNWQPVGLPVDHSAVFSFHPRKVLTTGEGGAISFAAAADAAQAKLLRHHGMSLSDLDRHQSGSLESETYLMTGFNYRMSDIHAAIGIVQLRYIDERLQIRRRLAEKYQTMLSSCAGIVCQEEPRYAKSNWQSFVITAETQDMQARIRKTLQQDGIASRPGIMCTHLHPPYQVEASAISLPNSERAFCNGVTLPLYSQMTENDLERVSEIVHRCTE